ncbi:hypothetical protein QJS10_CPA02g01251 [Acorus calamus]|uniref:GH18 domain-containing protein n=1 Tax=Acorus calamus TaxID=4465 RepID=A0AAV9FET3_ACOCL|nr:hypothetical protein QJS10_CPA02g01251 [Acorus calamus]
MSGMEDTQSRFIRSTIEVARENDVDGLDLDWETPKDAEEMVNLDNVSVDINNKKIRRLLNQRPDSPAQITRCQL